MNSFVFHCPTKILFGENSERQVGAEIKLYQVKRVFLLHSGSAAKTGLVDRVVATIRDEGLYCKASGGVQPNPRLTFARESVKAALDFQADFILAVGGGSVIDTAKAVAHGVANPNRDIWEFWTQKAVLEASLPVGVILTIAAAGSESSASAVLTDEASQQKLGFDSPFNRPQFAILNPQLTGTLPAFQVACGVVDILMHTMDRYFTPTEHNELTDAIAEALLRTVIQNGPAAVQNPKDYHAMSELMWCGSISHNGLTGLGALWDFAPHALSRELGSLFDTPHGAALSAVWGSWARYCYEQNPRRFARFACYVWRITEPDNKQAAIESIEKTEAFFSSLGMPICFSQLSMGVQNADTLRVMAHKCSNGGTRTVGTFRTLSEEDLYHIYMLANH